MALKKRRIFLLSLPGKEVLASQRLPANWQWDWANRVLRLVSWIWIFVDRRFLELWDFAMQVFNNVQKEKDFAVAWRGPRKNSMIDQFLSKVIWGQLDALVIDTPPGTSDEHISVVEKIREYCSKALRGAIIVSTPQVSVINTL